MKRLRQYLGILIALIAYYCVHEGAHLLPETFAAIAFGVILIAHIVVVWKVLWPRYTQSFKENN